jgi:DNA-binding response OmpR family regulator
MNSTPLFSLALLVEDEANLATALQVALKKLNIPSHTASTLEEARRLIKELKPEFILLDRTLPDGDGLQLCSSLRENGFSGTILILTASGQIEDRVQGLNKGADDYLPKPFSWEELEARIRALARRKTTFHAVEPAPPSLWNIDESQLRILGPKGWVNLTPLEFKLAARMIQQQGKIISRSGLLKDVWGFTLLPKTRTVDHFLGRLRKHFEQNPEEPKHFLTIRGAGYRFEP